MPLTSYFAFQIVISLFSCFKLGLSLLRLLLVFLGLSPRRRKVFIERRNLNVKPCLSLFFTLFKLFKLLCFVCLKNLVFFEWEGRLKAHLRPKAFTIKIFFRKQRSYPSFLSVVDRHTNRQPEPHWFTSLVPFPKVGDGRCTLYILYATIGFYCKGTYLDMQNGPHLFPDLQ